MTVTSSMRLCLLPVACALILACAGEASQEAEKGCNAGELKCVGTDIWQCSQDGNAFHLLQTCIGGTECLAGQCTPVDEVPDVVVDIGPTCEEKECEALMGKAPACRVWACENDACLLDDVANGAACNDGNACTVDDVCQTGVCLGNSLECDDGIDCTLDSCDPGAGCVHETENAACEDQGPCMIPSCSEDGCTYSAADTATSCDDGDSCTADDRCDGKGSCFSGEPVGSIWCKYDQDCGDQSKNQCLGAQVCVQVGCDMLCLEYPGSATICTETTDLPCMVIRCLPETGSCEEVPVLDFTECDDGDPCTDGDLCQDAECIAGPQICDGCLTDADCEDAEDFDLCNGTLICDLTDFPDTKCMVDPATVVHCDTSMDTACTKTLCEEGSGQCELTHLEAGAPCWGPEACYGQWSCDGAGDCDAEPVDCHDDNQCTDDLCDVLTGLCANLANDENECDGPLPLETYHCVAGTCVPEL
jgi:hypothetical protein